jgi:AhpC/TSA family protein
MPVEQEGMSPELQVELRKLQEDLLSQLSPETAAIMSRAAEELVRSGIAGRALHQGTKAPDFTLPNAVGKEVSLHDLLAEGPAVVTFYRGAW